MPVQRAEQPLAVAGGGEGGLSLSEIVQYEPEQEQRLGTLSGAECGSASSASIASLASLISPRATAILARSHRISGL